LAGVLSSSKMIDLVLTEPAQAGTYGIQCKHVLSSFERIHLRA
jgi:hypothetical protein